ncbi:hypothetical protein KFK14_19605 [Sphingobium phenoxybenzoativorans]|uniref:Uncharacterized protein n=1 Tax=Sphingobium phenoxybenzoativorans TaxID=1592790 RepID=A0A975K6D0_9SPHN|nr:hypothetical protein [Sphingobium phenoxybenzoativorans]QUT05179.1 hypothetical protein KFK14_19605 [Sphingobium phenoxybenzoativorans]
MNPVAEIQRPFEGQNPTVDYGFDDGSFNIWISHADDTLTKLDQPFHSIDDVAQAMQAYASKYGMTVKTVDQIRAQFADDIEFIARADAEASEYL